MTNRKNNCIIKFLLKILNIENIELNPNWTDNTKDFSDRPKANFNQWYGTM